MIKDYLESYKKNFHKILSARGITSEKKFLERTWQIQFTNPRPTYPFFADSNFNFTSSFVEYWLIKYREIGWVREGSLRLTRRGIQNLPTIAELSALLDDLKVKSTNFSIPPYYTYQNKIVGLGLRYKLLLDTTSEIFSYLLPLNTAFYYLLSHWNKDSMHSFYPIYSDGTNYISLAMGGERQGLACPDNAILKKSFAKYQTYLRKYINDIDNYLLIIVNHLFEIGKIDYFHCCGQKNLSSPYKNSTVLSEFVDETLNKRIRCPKCFYTPTLYIDHVILKGGIANQWRSALLSELYFYRLLHNHFNENNLTLYPRIQIEGISGDCDSLMIKNDEIFIFELKRSTNPDSYAKKGIEQLNNMKDKLHDENFDVYTVLISNIEKYNDPIFNDVDVLVRPSEIKYLLEGKII